MANECAHLIYHRPGHGEGMEGHQPPYHALGDYTVMRPGMHFSNDPGLYDPANGFSFNHGGFPKCEVHNLNHVHCYGNAQPYTR